MKALVLTDYWKSKLSKGDHITDNDYPVEVLLRAEKGGYVAVINEKPTKKNTVSEIKDYLEKNGIEYDSNALKDELLDLI